jgi:hypothetical protein
VNLNDPTGLMIAPLVGDSITFSTTVYARPISGDFPAEVLMAVLQRGTPRNTGIALRQSDIWDDMFDIAATALYQYAGGFSKRLREGDIPEDCMKDIVALGITPEAWAGVLDDLVIQNGIGSKEPYYTALPVGSIDRKVAEDRKLTVGSNFGGSRIRAISSVNDNRVWIDPRLVNPGDWSLSSGLIAHEALHKFPGLIDTEIQARLGLPVGAASENIGLKLAADCNYSCTSIWCIRTQDFYTKDILLFPRPQTKLCEECEGV